MYIASIKILLLRIFVYKQQVKFYIEFGSYKCLRMEKLISHSRLYFQIQLTLDTNENLHYNVPCLFETMEELFIT